MVSRESEVLVDPDPRCAKNAPDQADLEIVVAVDGNGKRLLAVSVGHNVVAALDPHDIPAVLLKESNEFLP